MKKKDFSEVLREVGLNTAGEVLKILRRTGEEAEITYFERLLTIALLLSVQGESKEGIGFTQATLDKAAKLLKKVEDNYTEFPVDSFIKDFKS